jgi:glycosyltransferase involved in cell wall biosynthesis
LLKGANIVCFASIDWAFNWHAPQEVASAFAEAGNRVLFIENTGVRRLGWRDAPRVSERLNNWRRARGGVRSLGNGVDVYSPVLVPLPYSRAAGFVNAHVLLGVARRWLSADRDRPLVIITFLPTPLVLALVHALKPSCTVYYCIDRLAESSPGARRLRESEPKLVAEADLVLITAENLRSEAMNGARVELLPSGVRFPDFETARRDGSPPPLLRGLKRPIIGFVGSVRKQTDLALLTEVASLAPDLTFVFLGPVAVDANRLNAQTNVRLLGAVPHDVLVRTMTYFDAGILAYVLDDFTTGIMPAKLKEYVAAGLPVVSTPLPEVRRFADKHPGIIDFAADATAFVAAVRSAVALDEPSAVERRLQVARQYDWSEQLSHASDLIEQLMTTAAVQRTSRHTGVRRRWPRDRS